MEYAHQKLENGAKSFYDRIRRPADGLRLKMAVTQNYLQARKIFCEVCSLRFTEVYPFLESDIIEVHHIIPLSKLTEKTKTTLNDLILLCANCHLAVHQGDAEENLLSAIEHFSVVANRLLKNAQI